MAFSTFSLVYRFVCTSKNLLITYTQHKTGSKNSRATVIFSTWFKFRDDDAQIEYLREIINYSFSLL